MSPKWIFIPATITEPPQPSTIYFAFDGTSESDAGGFGSIYDSSTGGEFKPNEQE